MMDIKIFTTGGFGGAVEGGECFFNIVTILYLQCNKTNITYQQFYSCLR